MSVTDERIEQAQRQGSLFVPDRPGDAYDQVSIDYERQRHNFEKPKTWETAMDDDEEEFIRALAKWCDCCPECQPHPCGGLLAGGMCDKMLCRCDDIWWDAELSEDEDTGE